MSTKFFGYLVIPSNVTWMFFSYVRKNTPYKLGSLPELVAFYLFDKNVSIQKQAESNTERISFRGKMTNQWIWKQMENVDVMGKIAYLKWNWVGYITRVKNERWTRNIMNWRSDH